MGKAKSATPAVEATAGVTSKEETILPTANTEDQGALIRDLESKLKAAGLEIIELRDSLSTAAFDLQKSVNDLAAALQEIRAKDLEIENLKTQSTALVSDHPEHIEARSDFEYNGRRYGFTDRAPKKLSFDGQLYTQQELLNDEDAMTSLIVGESAFIKRIV